jgi:hypothetical protein
MPYDRETIAAVAARLIVESQLTDWSLARRKALEQLGLSMRESALPDDDEIIAEIRTYHALYGGSEHAAQIRSQRETALEVMRALSRFEPRLVGPVAEGWAHEGSDAVIELLAESSKDVEIELVNLGADVDAQERRDGSMHLHIADADWPIRLVVRARGRALDSRHKVRLTTQQIKQLLIESPD